MRAERSSSWSGLLALILLLASGASAFALTLPASGLLQESIVLCYNRANASLVPNGIWEYLNRSDTWKNHFQHNSSWNGCSRLLDDGGVRNSVNHTICPVFHEASLDASMTREPVLIVHRRCMCTNPVNLRDFWGQVNSAVGQLRNSTGRCVQRSRMRPVLRQVPDEDGAQVDSGLCRHHTGAVPVRYRVEFEIHDYSCDFMLN